MRMRRRRPQAGVGRAGCLVWMVIGAIVGLILYKVVPVKMHTSEFFDAMQEQCSFGSIKSDASIRDELYQKAADLNLPLRKEDILVSRTASTVRVEVHYQIPIEFPGYTYIWHEDHIVERPIFLT